tara:strand:+ start:540 stop:680 length:141 start_codon:yes stop_codon:yes gene_type:complete
MESMTPNQAEEQADEWLSEQLEEEKRENFDVDHEVVNGRDCDGTPF